MSIRKSFVALFLVFISGMSSPSMAGGVEFYRKPPFSGAYLGMGVGSGFVFSKQRVTNTATPTTTTASVDSYLGRLGFVGDVHLGLGGGSKGFYLGVQIFGQGWTTSTSITQIATTATTIAVNTDSVRIQSAYGIVVRPGLKVNRNALIYLDVGAAFANLKAAATGVAVAGGVPATTIIKRHRSSKPGLKVGIGTSLAASRHFAVGLEYFYSDYGHFNLPSLVRTGASITSSIRVADHATLLTLDCLF